MEMTNIIPPDYTQNDYPREDDDVLEEVLETDEARIEKILDEQEELKEELLKEEENKPMSETPFSGTPWQPNKTEEKAPWEKDNPQTNSNPWGSSSSIPTWGGSSWGTPTTSSKPWESNSGSSTWGNPQKPSNETLYITTPIHKRVVICDLLDCLYETWESNERPDILPRAIFDLKPKFKVWDRIKSLSPERIYVIFPSGDLVPSFGNQMNAEATLNYVAQSISTFLMLPRQCCQILRPLRLNSPKENILLGAIQNEGSRDDMVYVGVHSGRFGLSSRDLTAAKNSGIDYIDLYNLLEGRYNYE